MPSLANALWTWVFSPCCHHSPLPIPAGCDLRALVVGSLGILVTGHDDGGIEGLGDIEIRKSRRLGG